MDYTAQLRHFLDGEGLVKQIPAKQKMKLYVLLHVASKLEANRQYSEMDINGAINKLTAFRDPATVRRDLVDFGFVQRKSDGSAYWLADPQPTPQSLGIEE